MPWDTEYIRRRQKGISDYTRERAAIMSEASNLRQKALLEIAKGGSSSSINAVPLINEVERLRLENLDLTERKSRNLRFLVGLFEVALVFAFHTTILLGLASFVILLLR